MRGTAPRRRGRRLTEKLARAPAPLSTTTLLKPALRRAATPWGVSATRRSFSNVSRGTPAGAGHRARRLSLLLRQQVGPPAWARSLPVLPPPPPPDRGQTQSRWRRAAPRRERPLTHAQLGVRHAHPRCSPRRRCKGGVLLAVVLLGLLGCLWGGNVGDHRISAHGWAPVGRCCGRAVDGAQQRGNCAL